MSVVIPGNYDANGNLNVAATFQDGPVIDAFGRARVSNPVTLFDSKQIFDNQPLFWDDQETSGSGTSSTHSADAARSRLSVSNLTAGSRTRQTFQRFNYQPGKSQLVYLTTVLINALENGIKTCVGLFDDDNGLFFTADNGTLKVVRRTNATGTPVDNEVAQSSWNLDKLDGSGASGITIDPTKTQIICIDFEWLGVGRVRMGFVVDGKVYHCHEFNNANNLDAVYMSTPNLPARYYIENDGTGPAASMDHICVSIQSEGGQEDNGAVRYFSSGSTGITMATSGTLYAALGIRLKAAYLGETIKPVNVTAIATSSDSYEWQLILNPTITTGFTYADITNSAVQADVSGNNNTVSGGTIFSGGFVKGGNNTGSITQALESARTLGANIAGTRDELVLCIRPLSNNLILHAGIEWRELV